MDGSRVNSVGFYIGRESLYWVILETQPDGKIELKSIENIPYSEPLDFSNFLCQVNKNKIYEALLKFPSYQFEDKKVNLSIDSSHAYITKLPIQKKLHPEELKEHLEWEFSQHFLGENPENYSISFHPINVGEEKPFDSIILLIIQKQILNFFRFIFEDIGLRLKVSDVDHFTAETICKFSYPEINYLNNFLISFKLNYFELSLIQYGELINYRKVAYTNYEDAINYFERELAPIVRSMKSKIGKIYIWGEKFARRFVDEMNSVLPVEVIMINPFKNFIINKQVLNSPVYENFHEFSAACGVALRR